MQDDNPANADTLQPNPPPSGCRCNWRWSTARRSPSCRRTSISRRTRWRSSSRAFEGPLDLLLYLIRKQNIDILDIPVAEITRQYMGYVELMKAVRLELAAEYLVMAAMLAEIKSRMLLPRSAEAEEEEEDPRAELIRRLQGTNGSRAAEDLDELPRVGRDVLVPAVAAPEARARKLLPELALQELMLVMGEMLRRADLFESHQVTREVLSTRERMSEVLERLKAAPSCPSSSCSPWRRASSAWWSPSWRSSNWSRQMVELVQNEAFGAIHVRLRIAREAEEGETLEEALGRRFRVSAPLAVRPPADGRLFRASGFAPAVAC